MSENNLDLYDLSNGLSLASLMPFSAPLDEYSAAFVGRAYPFLNYYSFQDGEIQLRCLTRGDFWDMAKSAAASLHDYGLLKGDRIILGFSENSLYDPVFRLASIMMGCVPVTINWQADDDEYIVYKTRLTGSKVIIYDAGFAVRVGKLKTALPSVNLFEASKVEDYNSSTKVTQMKLSYDDEQMIIFTSGTTGKPRGVSLSYRTYLATRLTFEQYFNMAENTRLDLLLVNPLHHVNSSALFDLGMRRGGTIIHLLQHYTTAYWKILVDVARQKRELLVTSLVSRHIDFLETLAAEAKLPVDEAEIKKALSKTNILIGSAPVGPTTVKRMLKFSNHLPLVRFGSTETCLQVMATPRTMPPDVLMEAFEAGWLHCYDGQETTGYYIGREHFPFTRVKLVKSIELGSSDYFRPCEIGEPGYLITQGPNVMSGYVGDIEATKRVFREGWYTGLRDIAFALKNKRDGQLDYYWLSRDSALLIRGGANYAYEQVAAELTKVLIDDFRLQPNQFSLAVIGIRLESEHEDSCCVTIELKPEVACFEPTLRANFIGLAARKVSKGARPDYVRFARIPLNFKGVLYSQLKQDFLDLLKNTPNSKGQLA